MWPTSLLFLASKGLFKSKVFSSLGFYSMPQGRPSSKSLGAKSFKTVSVLSYVASTLMSGISHSAHFGSHSPLDGPSCSSNSSALSLRLHMLSIRASRSGILDLPKSSCNSGSGSISSLCHTLPSALGSNTLGSVVAAFSAIPISLMLAVFSVEAGVGSTSVTTRWQPH